MKSCRFAYSIFHIYVLVENIADMKKGVVGGKGVCIRGNNGLLICGGKVIAVGRKRAIDEEGTLFHISYFT